MDTPQFDRAALLAFFAPSIVETPVKVTDKDGKEKEIVVYVRELSAEQVFALRAIREKSENKEDSQDFATNMLAMAMVDPNGTPLFKDAKEAGTVLKSKISGFNALTREVAIAAGIANKPEPKGDDAEGADAGN